MKQFIAASLSAIVAFAQEEDESTAEPSSQCLYCRNQDLLSGFMTSYHYCQQQDFCLQDLWNYINRDCGSEWVLGKDINLN